MRFDWLKHAFAIEPEGSFEPSETQRAAVDRLCRAVIDRGLVTPALLFLESVQPLGSVTAQTIEFFRPMLTAVGDSKAIDELVAFLERRGSVEFVARRLEELARGAERP